jgi:DNA (cytosine-5)-methyltransferase 1
MSKKNLLAKHKLPKHDTIRVFEGFAGYGGASFGLKRSGLKYKVVGMSEFNPFASELLAANFPKIKNWGDITKIDPKELPDFDLFTGGFPCQPFSSAGMQMGEDDRYGRGTLFYEIMRILKEKRPRYLLLENVKGFTAKKFEPTRNRIKEILRELGYGELQYAILNSCDYGIPQNRERIWMFAMLGGVPEGFSIVPPKIELTKRFGDLLDKDAPSYLYLSQAQIAHLKEKHHIESFVVKEPLCFDVYNKKIKTNALSITITQPEHNSLRVIEVPKEDGVEIVRKMSVDEQFRFMGFEDGELNYANQSYSQLSTRAGNGWDVNLVGILLNHIFNQIL